ncbi:hypothetical protein HN446_00235 [bacterium]|jgi:putative intracellular protease/amidase|nr:hypothetical protein [bacterium]
MKFYIIIFLVFSATVAFFFNKKGRAKRGKSKSKINVPPVQANKGVGLVVASKGFQPVEYFDTKKEIEKAGLKVITISDSSGSALSAGAPGGVLKAKVDVTLDNVNLNLLSGFFIIGGPGATEILSNNNNIKTVLREVHGRNMPFGAICISPRILATFGLLQGKKATGWNGDGKLEEIFEKNGVVFVDQPVARDGMIITASGPSASKAFGKTIVEAVSLV